MCVERFWITRLTSWCIGPPQSFLLRCTQMYLDFVLGTLCRSCFPTANPPHRVSTDVSRGRWLIGGKWTDRVVMSNLEAFQDNQWSCPSWWVCASWYEQRCSCCDVACILCESPTDLKPGRRMRINTSIDVFDEFGRVFRILTPEDP